MPFSMLDIKILQGTGTMSNLFDVAPCTGVFENCWWMNMVGFDPDVKSNE